MLKEALCESEITLALAWEEPTHQPVLLASTTHMTCFCRSMDAPVPRTWTSVLHSAHEAELWIRREELLRPLKFLAGSVAENACALSLLTEGSTLWMCPFALKDASVQEQRAVPLVRSSSDLSLLVDPKAFKRLVRSVKDEVLHLQIGHFERQEDQACKRIGFVRIASEPTTVMMGLSRSEPGVLSSSSRAKRAREAVVGAEATEPALVSQGA